MQPFTSANLTHLCMDLGDPCWIPEWVLMTEQKNPETGTYQDVYYEVLDGGNSLRELSDEELGRKCVDCTAIQPKSLLDNIYHGVSLFNRYEAREVLGILVNIYANFEFEGKRCRFCSEPSLSLVGEDLSKGCWGCQCRQRRREEVELYRLERAAQSAAGHPEGGRYPQSGSSQSEVG